MNWSWSCNNTTRKISNVIKFMGFVTKSRFKCLFSQITLFRFDCKRRTTRKHCLFWIEYPKKLCCALMKKYLTNVGETVMLRISMGMIWSRQLYIYIYIYIYIYNSQMKYLIAKTTYNLFLKICLLLEFRLGWFS
jgi:hypothetical protein